MRPWLEVDVRTRLGDSRLAELAFTASAPVTGVFGASGAGKSTLLEVIAGVRAATGRVTFQREVWLDSKVNVPPESRGVGYVPQDGRLFPHLTVRGNLLSAANANLATSESQAWFQQVISALELSELLNRRPATLSGGERQRVALGRALSARPQLLLLDEPFGALDRPLRRRLLPFVRRACAASNVPVLMVSHDPTELLALCEQTVVIDGDHVRHAGPSREVLAEQAALRGQVHKNVVPCEVIGRREETYLVRLSGGTEVISGAPVKGTLKVGDDAQLVLPATDVLLAAERPRGMSARNVLPAEVSKLRDWEAGVQVVLRLDEESELVADISRASKTELGLSVGTQQWVVFKARSCELLEA